MKNEIQRDELKVGATVRLGSTTGDYKGLQDGIAEILSIDGNFCIVKKFDGLSGLLDHKTEIKLSEWTFFEVSPAHVKTLFIRDEWAEEIL